jgi:hypothetical protein
MQRNTLFLTLLFCFSAALAAAQQSQKGADTLTYQTQAGLPIAASKIYFSESKFTFSGYGETNYINYRGPKNRQSNDLELYMTNMQRFVAYAAWRPKNWLVLYAEIFAEYANDGNRESHFEYLPEVFVDFLLSDRFNVRIGSHQPQIGYINNNDEPVMFYTVNRPEVERLIIPSTWIDFGVMTYGNLSPTLKYSASVYQGLDHTNLNSATWIRRGRDETLRFNFDSYVLNSSLKYSGIKDTEIALNGFWTRMARNQTVTLNNEARDASAATYLASSYIRHSYKNWTFMALGAYGSMRNTESLFALGNQLQPGAGQAMGEKVYGYYTEVGYDLLPILGLNKRKQRGKQDNLLVRSHELKLPVFARFERLNTHAGVQAELQGEELYQSNLTALTIGANFNPRRSIVIKTNYQFRHNKAPLVTGEMEGNRFEAGLGFIF